MLVFQPTINNYDNMFAHLRSKQANAAKQQQDLLTRLSTTMRHSVRSQMHPLIQIDQHNNPDFAGPLAEIYMREFACMMQTLKQVNTIATLYHEHAFDNTGAYIECEPAFQPNSDPDTNAMTAEQRHASQLLLGVGNNYSEIHVALKMLGCDILFRDIRECKDTVAVAVAQQFRINPSLAEDAFDRLQHMSKQVWSLVNMLAFSNLFRFADPNHPVIIANPEDAIFIPYIPMKSFEDEYEPEQEQEQEQEQEPEPVPKSESDDDDEATTHRLKTVADWTAAL